MSTTKERLHRLIEDLPEAQLVDVEPVWEALLAHHADRLARTLLTTRLDDEPETTDERLAVAEAREALARGDVVRDEDLERELGR